MKKRLIASVVLAAMIIGTVAGCGKDKKSSQEEATTEQETLALTTEITDYSEYVTLGEYKGLSIDVDPADVTDEQLKKEIDSIRKALATYEQIKDRKVKDKDTIHLQYTGLLDGEAFEGGSTGESGTTYTVGGNYIKDLNDQLIGLECGKQYDLECTFPENYGNDDLNGKTVIFQVTVDYIQGEEILPDWTDEFINTYTESKYTSTAEYEAYMKDTLKESNLETQKNTYKESLISTIFADCKLGDLPEDKLEEEFNTMYNYYKSTYESYAAMYSMTYEEFLKNYEMTDAELQEYCHEYAEYNVKYIVIMCTIAAKEGLAIDQEEYNKNVSEYFEESGYESLSEFEEAYGQDYLLESIMVDKVAEYLMENNEMVVSETPSQTEAATK